MVIMDQDLSFISYNSTGLDRIKIAWINELLETFDADCLQIQEHFKAIKTIEQFFKSNFKKYDSYVKKAVRDNSSHAGRPRGGLAQFVCMYVCSCFYPRDLDGAAPSALSASSWLLLTAPSAPSWLLLTGYTGKNTRPETGVITISNTSPPTLSLKLNPSVASELAVKLTNSLGSVNTLLLSSSKAGLKRNDFYKKCQINHCPNL